VRRIARDAGTDSAPSKAAVRTDAEVAAGVEAAHTIGRRVAAHARASTAVKRALRHGVDVICHFRSFLQRSGRRIAIESGELEA
jgi:imidazolonepropionase-like amidohydrolase